VVDWQEVEKQASMHQVKKKLVKFRELDKSMKVVSTKNVDEDKQSKKE